MSSNERLQALVERALLRLGDKAKEKLALSAGLGVSTIRNIVAEGHVPLAKNVFRLAIACGCSEEEALQLTKECASQEAKETA